MSDSRVPGIMTVIGFGNLFSLFFPLSAMLQGEMEASAVKARAFENSLAFSEREKKALSSFLRTFDYSKSDSNNTSLANAIKELVFHWKILSRVTLQAHQRLDERC